MDSGMPVSHKGQALLPVRSGPQEDVVSLGSMERHSLPCSTSPSPCWGAVGHFDLTGDSPQLLWCEWDPGVLDWHQLLPSPKGAQRRGKRVAQGAGIV